MVEKGTSQGPPPLPPRPAKLIGKTRSWLLVVAAGGAVVLLIAVAVVLAVSLIGRGGFSTRSKEDKRIYGCYIRRRTESHDIGMFHPRVAEVPFQGSLRVKENGEFTFKETVMTVLSQRLPTAPPARGTWKIKGNKIIFRKEDGSIFMQGKLEKRLTNLSDVVSGGYARDVELSRPDRERWCIIEDDGTIWKGPTVYEEDGRSEFL